MKRLGIISDNIIGANDTGVKFSKFGLPTFVSLDVDNLDAIEDTIKVISVNTNTRHANPQEAYKCVSEVTDRLKKVGIDYFYKKIDSTLRGNPGIEIQGILDTLKLDMCVIVPSFPDHRRIVENGYLLVKSSKEDNADYPVCHIPTLLESEIETQVGLINLSDVRTGAKHLEKKLFELKTSGIKFIVVDAVSEGDLAVIANAIKVYSNHCLIAGSAGLTAHLPFVLDFNDNDSKILIKEQPSILVIAATFNQTTADQIAELKKMKDIRVIELATELLNKNKEEVFEKLLSEAEEALRNNLITVIATDTLLKNREELEGYKISENVSLYGTFLAEGLGNTAKALALRGLVTDIVVTGGGTTSYVVKQMGADGIILEQELLSGIPLGKLKGGKCEGIRIITKAGGFGTKDALAKVVAFLKNTNLYAIVD
ncbi:four-carbon acid sugar kinase family protein [Clostridium formicaceticum]|uniref:Serine kinase n=1 Tax=Clostridium formicaceticum TaxID=1497 RepID=A0AAC9WEW3_9CLOT|nr:four-carbon acid sugar kinase family protein [Clostridium formicaceticum]AOY75863.1 hypothetical protein BJL90_08130 [Clostridium formicaceticum]ARE86202.1 hypothetical protein CLFO_05240 [Clostridium formicaceticum]